MHARQLRESFGPFEKNSKKNIIHKYEDSYDVFYVPKNGKS